MDELDEIKKKKLEALKSQQSDQMQEQQQMQRQIAQLESVVKQALTKEALERYGNLKAAFPDRAVQLLVILAQSIQSGQITQVDDKTLKELLKKLSPGKKDIKIKRI